MQNQTQQLIKKYKHKKQIEVIKTIAYHGAEFITLIGIFALGIAIITIL
jgi:hypothetical protein